MNQGLSVRKAAACMGVHRTTAFRWRHRFLALPRDVKANELTGVAEVDETYVLRSYKGQRRNLIAEQTRKPRHCGGKAAKRGLSAEQLPILVLRNRAGQTTDDVPQAANKRCVTEVLQPALADDVVLCTDGSSMLAKVASELGIEHHAVNTLRGEHTRGTWHIQNVNAPQPIQAMHAPLQWCCHVASAQLPRLVPSAGPQRTIRRQARLTVGSAVGS